MKNSLLGKIGEKIIKPIGRKVLPYVAAGVILFSGCSNYEEKLNIKGGEVYYDTKVEIFQIGTRWDVKEIKSDGTIIKYALSPSFDNPSRSKIFNLQDYKIDGKRFGQGFSEVDSLAKESISFLLEEYFSFQDSVQKRKNFIKDSLYFSKKEKALKAFK